MTSVLMNGTVNVRAVLTLTERLERRMLKIAPNSEAPHRLWKTVAEFGCQMAVPEENLWSNAVDLGRMLEEKLQNRPKHGPVLFFRCRVGCSARDALAEKVVCLLPCRGVCGLRNSLWTVIC